MFDSEKVLDIGSLLFQSSWASQNSCP